MTLTKNAIEVLERRYLKKDSNGKVCETPDDMFRRVARVIASAEKDSDKYEASFYEMLTDLRFMPNSPTLMNAGRDLGQLSACFVLPIGDSMEEIFDAVKNAALIHKSGGGTGFSFSALRPEGARVRSTGGVASGPISFMKVFNAATEAVKQGGTRRGANMGLLRVDHPDIEKFITCKKDHESITNFNISVGITEDFMNKAEAGEDYDLIDPHSGEPAGTLNAKAVFDEIVHGAWENGEPGILFLDRVNRDNVAPSLGEIVSTNPCGEQPLLPYEACNLGSINLTRFITKDGDLDEESLKKTVRLSVRFLDDVITVNKYPLEKIDAMTKSLRKVGLGVMGFADMLFMMGIPYDSEDSVVLARRIMRLIEETGIDETKQLAIEKGAFPEFENSIFAGREKRRNATVTTIAPTGTISGICGCSSGVEPAFAIAYIRNVMDGTLLYEVNPVFKSVAIKRGFYSEELMREIAEKGSVQHVDGVPDDIKRVFVTAHDIEPEDHIAIQAAFQEFVDNAVSKTVNLRNDATEADVADVYRLAYRLGCKGVTVYRDGSRDSQVLNVGALPAEKREEQSSHVEPRPRPTITRGITEKIKTGCGNLYVTVNYDEKGICEVFTNNGKAGGCPSQSEATARLASMSLRAGVSIDAVMEQLKGIRCMSAMRRENVTVLSCPDAIGKVLEKAQRMVEAENPAMSDQKSEPAPNCTAANPVSGNICPECGAQLREEGGCNICVSCGYSKCG